MHTGDLATMDDEGYVNIVGRIKDMIIRGGENIYPREIEEFLYTHPAIADVQVIGVPDERYGEEVCAWVVLKDGRDARRGRGPRRSAAGKIARFKIPRYVRFVDALPADGHRQGAEVPDARARDRGAGPASRGGRRNGLADPARTASDWLPGNELASFVTRRDGSGCTRLPACGSLVGPPPAQIRCLAANLRGCAGLVRGLGVCVGCARVS